ncbi:pre-mRNA-processing protein 40A isoform X1 [Lactuca sativa]|uniref:Pre-mRNA-processing protein 40A n=2 Tax=Lactuca sativa TaxID=4236 RepID=A0A9R1X4M9_LACSA|nr:pre-mRNA-processing protein 40A isoform X1 [Lactuca sativa]KAJ0200590.1 hypothetical protein LSAT_V11C600340230 [Lactuca sativa]
MANNSQYPGIQPPRPTVAPMGPPQNSYPSVPMQFRPTGPPRAPPQYMPLVSQQFLPVGRPMQHLPPHGMVPPPPPPPAAQAFSVPDGSRVAFSITYNTSATSQVHISAETTSQYQPTSSLNNILPSFPLLQPVEKTPDAPSVPVTSDLLKPVEKAPSDWIEHTSRNGKRYYHNKKTKMSSWEKPLDLMSPIERADASTDWKECIAPDGRKYYYNKVTKQSKWKIPDELKLAREQVKTESKTNEHELTKTKDVDKEHEIEPLVPSVKNSPSSHPHEPVSSPVVVQSGTLLTAELATGPTESSKEVKASEETFPNHVATSLYNNTEDVSVKDAENGTPIGNLEEPEKSSVTNLEEKTVDQETHVYETKQEGKNAFKALLENANVASDWTWDQAMRVIINDRRYSALRSLSERKQAFNEFIGQKKKHEAEERRNKQKKAREEFKKMLDESKEITYTTKWSKAIAIFEDDDRFKAVERFKEREELFEDHIMELEKKEKSKALEEHKKNKKEYIEFLKSCDFLTASSQWRKVQDRLEADESCLRLEKVDRLEIFQEYIHDLEKDEEEQRKLRVEEIRKTERKNRDEFRKLMEGHIASGMLTSKSHWREYCNKVKELPAYLAVSSNSSGATPKDLFEDVLEELEKQYIEDRDRIKEAVKMRKVSMSSSWTLEEFKNAIAEDITSSPLVSAVNLKIVFDELQERVREREEKEAKRRKRLGDDFYLSLNNSKEITSSSRWDDFKPHFEARQENWFTVEESFFKEIFDKHVTELKKARDERKHREDKAKKSLDRRMEKSRREKDRSSKKDKRRKDDSDTDNGERPGDSFSHDDNNNNNNNSNNRRSVRENNNNKEKKHRKRDRSLDHEDDKDRSRDSYRHSLERKRVKQLEQQSSVEYESRHKRYKRDHNRRDDQKEAEDGEVW